MTLDEFLLRLRETPRDWCLHLNPVMGFQEIRTAGGRDPIEAVFPPSAGQKALVVAYDAGMDIHLLGKIITAADGNWDSPLRQQLLEACGLDHAEVS